MTTSKHKCSVWTLRCQVFWIQLDIIEKEMYLMSIICLCSVLCGKHARVPKLKYSFLPTKPWSGNYVAILPSRGNAICYQLILHGSTMEILIVILSSHCANLYRYQWTLMWNYHVMGGEPRPLRGAFIIWRQSWTQMTNTQEVNPKLLK